MYIRAHRYFTIVPEFVHRFKSNMFLYIGGVGMSSVVSFCQCDDARCLDPRAVTRSNCTYYISFSSIRVTFLPRDAMHKLGLCRRAVSVRPSVRLSVCPSRSCIRSKRINLSSIFFTVGNSHHSNFPHQTLWQYSDGNNPNGASNAGRVGKIAIFHHYLASSRVVNGSIARYYTHCAGPWEVGDTHRW